MMSKNNSEIISFTWQGVTYYYEDGQYFKFRYGKKLSISRKNFIQLKKKFDDTHKRD